MRRENTHITTFLKSLIWKPESFFKCYFMLELVQWTYVKMGELNIKAFTKLIKSYDRLFRSQPGFLSGNFHMLQTFLYNSRCTHRAWLQRQSSGMNASTPLWQNIQRGTLSCCIRVLQQAWEGGKINVTVAARLLWLNEQLLGLPFVLMDG